METIHLKINNIPVEAPKGTKIIEAAKRIGIDIPHLCYHPDQRVKARCRVCSVQVAGKSKLLASCSTEVWEGMEVFTDTQIVRDAQVGILELIMADHAGKCHSCQRNGTCELQALCTRFNIVAPDFTALPSVSKNRTPVDTNPSIVRDPAKCIKCGRCIRACKDVQGIEALTFANRSDNIIVTTPFDLPMEKTDCTLCGQCSLVCPTGALVEKDDTQKVLDALQDPEKHVIVQTAPSIRVSIGDAFGLEPGAVVTGQMVTALRMIGFDKVFDTNFGADLTIVEEGAEFIHRVQHGGVLPMLTSCSPGWINFIEKQYPELLPNVSTTKSPMSIFGAVAKTYYPKVTGIPVEKIFTVSIMPCTAKKFEAARPEMGRDGHQDVDAVLTSRELARLIQYAGLNIKNLPESNFDSPLGTGTGAAAIFGKTGGVMEAALRTVYEKLTGTDLPALEYNPVTLKRPDGYPELSYVRPNIREASFELDGRTFRIAIVHTLLAARLMMEQVKEGAVDYDFIEIMACPGGCIGGGGQPIGTTNAKRDERIKALEDIDENLPLRKSHENPDLIKLYEDYLGEFYGEMAHKYLHTHNHKVKKLYEF